MWWAGSKDRDRGRGQAVDVYVGTRALAICDGHERVLGLAVAGLEEGLAALGEWLKTEPATRGIRVWLSGGLCRPFKLSPVPGVKGDAELRRIAESTAARHSGLAGDCRVWMDRGKASESRVCAAVQTSVVDLVLRTVSASGGQRTLSIRPWWSETLRSVLVQHPDVLAVATHDCDSLTVLIGRGRNFDLVNTLTPLVDRDSADAALARQLISGDVDPRRHVLARLSMSGVDGARAIEGVALAPFAEVSR